MSSSFEWLSSSCFLLVGSYVPVTARRTPTKASPSNCAYTSKNPQPISTPGSRASSVLGVGFDGRFWRATEHNVLRSANSSFFTFLRSEFRHKTPLGKVVHSDFHAAFSRGLASPLLLRQVRFQRHGPSFLVRCGGDSHFCHSSHFFKVFSARDVVLPFIFKVFYEHIGKRMNVAF